MLLNFMSTFSYEVHVAFASPFGANTTNLIVNNGWNGILICGAENEKKNSEKYFTSHPDTNLFPPKIYKKWITRDNINEIVKQGMKDYNLDERTIDLFSLDIDSVDYWIWKALEAVEPRVVVLEYHNVLGEKSLTVPYSKDFNRFNIHPDYMGASLPAFVKLAKEKGYRLVGCNLHGYNAFFIKKGIAEDIIPEVSVQDCLNQPQAVDAHKNRYPEVADFDWLNI
jgi:hypothetical protein